MTGKISPFSLFSFWIFSQLKQVDLNPATTGARDQFSADARAQTEDVHQFQTILHFIDRIVGVADADGVADAAGEQVTERNDAADRPGFLRPGMRDAKV